MIYYYKLGDVVVQFVGALRYKLEVHRFGFLTKPLEFFINNSSGHTMALVLTQPLTEMSTRKSSWG